MKRATKTATLVWQDDYFDRYLCRFILPFFDIFFSNLYIYYVAYYSEMFIYVIYIASKGVDIFLQVKPVV